jgi:DNA-binding ferritin-like protein
MRTPSRRSSRRHPHRNRRTTARRGGAPQTKNNATKSRIVHTFLEILNTVKLYHWRTHSYAEHRATDDLYEELNKHIDQFVEVLLGKDASRIRMVDRRIQLMDVSTKTDLRKYIFECRAFLVDMNRYFDAKQDSDLLNIRDELLAIFNRFLYLLTFR